MASRIAGVGGGCGSRDGGDGGDGGIGSDGELTRRGGKCPGKKASEGRGPFTTWQGVRGGSGAYRGGGREEHWRESKRGRWQR